MNIHYKMLRLDRYSKVLLAEAGHLARAECEPSFFKALSNKQCPNCLGSCYTWMTKTE